MIIKTGTQCGLYVIATAIVTLFLMFFFLQDGSNLTLPYALSFDKKPLVPKLGELHNPKLAVHERQELRLSRIKRACYSSKVRKDFSPYTFDALPDLAAMQCHTAKVGSTHWSAIFRFLHLKHLKKAGNYTNPYDIPRLRVHEEQHYETYSPPGNWKALIDGKKAHPNTPFTFFFTRDPWARMWSVYVDKDFTNVCYRLPSFSEFVARYVIEKKWNQHITPVIRSCNPCQFTTDFVGAIETFGEDSQFILDRLNLSTLLPRQSREEHVRHEVTHLTRYNFGIGRYTGIPLTKCPDKGWRLASALWKVFQINGYIKKGTPLPQEPLGGWKSETVEAAILQALEKEPLSSAESRQQRQESMVTAWRGVSKKLRDAVRSHYKNDFDVFGYDKDWNP